MSITIKDVAKMSGVSISTVSRVINNSKPVSDDIRERVLEVIKETNYVPNPVARSLVLKKSNFIGVVVPDISDYKMGEILNGIEEVGKLYDYDILLCNSYGEFAEEKRYIDLLRNKQVAGIVFISWNMTQESVDLIKASNIPAIYISKNAKKFDIPSVGVDHFEAGRDVAKFLLSKQFKKPCVIDARNKDMSTESEIILGFDYEYSKNKKKFSKLNILYTKDKINEVYQQVVSMISAKKSLPDVFFATSDDVAAAVVNALMDNGIRVPQDVSVMGYDNSKVANIVRPQLTTVKQPLYDIGAMAIGVLIKRINGENRKVEAKVLPHDILERQSVR